MQQQDPTQPKTDLVRAQGIRIRVALLMDKSEMTNLAVLAMAWEIRVIELSLQANARLKERKERDSCLIKV